jgi:hypothetical protein
VIPWWAGFILLLSGIGIGATLIVALSLLMAEVEL